MSKWASASEQLSNWASEQLRKWESDQVSKWASEQVTKWASDQVSKFIKNITYIATIFNILNWKEVLMKINGRGYLQMHASVNNRIFTDASSVNNCLFTDALEIFNWN